MKSGSLINNYTLLLSIFLLTEGIWGLFSKVVFAFMTTNMTHAVIHLILGIAGIALALSHKAHGYLIFIGSLLLVVGILYMIPATSYLTVDILNLNGVAAAFNTVAGFIALMVAYVGTRYTYVNVNLRKQQHRHQHD